MDATDDDKCDRIQTLKIGAFNTQKKVNNTLMEFIEDLDNDNVKFDQLLEKIEDLIGPTLIPQKLHTGKDNFMIHENFRQMEDDYWCGPVAIELILLKMWPSHNQIGYPKRLGLFLIKAKRTNNDLEGYHQNLLRNSPIFPDDTVDFEPRRRKYIIVLLVFTSFCWSMEKRSTPECLKKLEKCTNELNNSMLRTPDPTAQQFCNMYSNSVRYLKAAKSTGCAVPNLIPSENEIAKFCKSNSSGASKNHLELTTLFFIFGLIIKLVIDVACTPIF
ncbi:DgyrCDS14537 [Dimorphilus gyrociliatus]|uniref:DgyrCDS14537 n=1 Tax=Dimorphilus gyrociliatus TaxID=2664684 RepID=A0A7I8WDZ2_9ANNE|nr:DgyrCDS14537 [Dimorphilus gyrociliatus]